MDWKTIAQLGMWSLALFMATPIVLALRWLGIQVYQAWRTLRQDRIELEALQTLAMARARQEQLVRLSPDQHGFGGVVYDQVSGAYRDLDTGESWTPEGPVTAAHGQRLAGNIKQRLLSALSGSTFVQRAVQEIVGEENEKPQIRVGEHTWLELESGDVGGEVEV